MIYGAPFHLRAAGARIRGGFTWPDLRLAVTTAAPLSGAVARDFRIRFGKPLVQGLGIIEIGLPLLNTGGARDAPTAVGRPLPAFDVELRDDEGRPVAVGYVGELWIKGPGMFDAYLSPWQTGGGELRGRLVSRRVIWLKPMPPVDSHLRGQEEDAC